MYIKAYLHKQTFACKPIPQNFSDLQRIPGHTDASPTSIAIVDESKDAPSRIFIAGLDGNVVEADLEHGRLSSSRAIDSCGGAVWQLAIQPTTNATTTLHQPNKNNNVGKQEENRSLLGNNSDDSDDEDDLPSEHNANTPRIAAACDDGAVRIFSVTPNGLEYSSTLPRAESRVLAVAWHPNGQHIISAGCDGCIHVWDIITQREVLRITANDSSGREIFIWSLLVLPDGTIVSGDSAGNVSFWDGVYGTLLNRFSQHVADVLQLSSSEDGCMVLAAGVDPQIAVFQKIQHATSDAIHQDNKGSWVYLSSKRPHTHDVRALCSLGGKLISAGNDTVLLVHSISRFLKEYPRKLNTCPQKPIINSTSTHAALHSTITMLASNGNDTEEQGEEGSSVVHHGSLLMAAQGNAIDIWRLSRPSTEALFHHGIERNCPLSTAAIEGEKILPKSSPVHMIKIINKTGNFITAAAFSPDEKFLAYSDAYRTLCFAIDAPSASLNIDEAKESTTATTTGLHIKPIQLPEDIPPAVALHFRPSTNELICLSIDGIIHTITMPLVSIPPSSHGLTASVRHVNRELHDLRYKMWYKRDRTRSAARRLMPPVELIALSFDGTWLAGVVRRRIHLIAMESHRIAASVTPHDDRSIVSAVGFTPDSRYLAVVSTTNDISAYEIPSGHPSAWSERHASMLPRRLLTLPGPLTGMSPSPASSSALLIYSSEAVCHVDVAAPLTPDPQESKRRQRRSMGASPAGQNARTMYCSDPVLYVQTIGAGEVLLVERAWRDVHATVAAPMYRHRYGT